MRGGAAFAVAVAASQLLVACAQDRPGAGEETGEPADACTIAAQSVFEPCCGADDPSACLYTTTTYAEMCRDRECTAALSAADAACSGETTASQAYQSFRLALSCEGLDDPCVESVQSTMQDTCRLNGGVLADDPAQLNVVAQQNVCNSQNCMAEMQTQLGTCGEAADVGTQLILQLFVSLLTACGVLAQPGTECSPEEMQEVMNLCGWTDEAMGTPTCTPECISVVMARVGQCPLSFTDPAMATLAGACGTNTATASALPCAPGVVDGLLSQSSDCDAFSQAFAAASLTPCADLATNPELGQAVTACSVSAVLPPCEPAAVAELLSQLPDCQAFAQALSTVQCTDERLQAALQECGTDLVPPADAGADAGAGGGALGVLSALNANCPEGTNVGNFQRACCPDTAKEAWPCSTPVCGNPLAEDSCVGLGSRCPAFLADQGAQMIMLTCAQQECDAQRMQAMQDACCPGSGPDAWPCDAPRCDSEECLNELTFLSQACPVALVNDDGVNEALQNCQQIQDAAEMAGVDDAAQRECQTNNGAAISQMHRACCPQGWPCASPAEAQCGTSDTECLGLLNGLVQGDCPSLLFDPEIQAIAAECASRQTVPDGGGRGGSTPGRGRGGAPGRGGQQSLQQEGTTTATVSPPSPPPPQVDSTDDGSSVGMLFGGLLVIAVAGAAYVKTKSSKSGGAVDSSDNMYTNAAPL